MRGTDKKSDSGHTDSKKGASARRRKNKLLFDEHNHSLNELSNLIERISETDSYVLLIGGESTASNEIVSRSIHALSARSEHLFNSVNCEQYSPEALEAYLFGVEKGVFSPSDELQIGQLEYCSNGTLLLHNIGDLESPSQAKLLRAIKAGSFNRIGGHSQIPLNTRLISSAHKDIAKQVEIGTFATDLFKCLNQSTISMPLLRRSSEDILVLIAALTKNFNYAPDNGYIISEDAIKILSQNSWSGSASDLADFLGKLSILYRPNGASNKHHYTIEQNQPTMQISDRQENVYELDKLDPARKYVHLPEAGIKLKNRMAEIEIQYIREALELSNGVVAQAAKLLGLRRTTLVEKLRKYEIQR